MHVLQVCDHGCTHKRCAKGQQIAVDDCAKCGHEIGFDEPYVEATNGAIFHVQCVAAKASDVPCQH